MFNRREILPMVAGAAGLGASGVAAAAGSKPSPPELRRVSYASKHTGAERDYFVYLPRGHTQSESWPVILFLHGDGERGDAKADLDYVLCHGPLYEAWIQKRDLPFIIVSPQLPLFAGAADNSFFRNRTRAVIPQRLAAGAPARPDETNSRLAEPMGGVIPANPEGAADDDTEGWQSIEPELLSMLDHVQREFGGDPRRVYLTGLSRGGFGAWWLAAKHPGRFAAIAPVVGYGHPDLAEPVAKTRLPLWQFAGGRDPAVPLRFFFVLLDRLEALGHPAVRFTIHEDLGHFTWVRVYGGQDLYDWFLANRRVESAHLTGAP
jgi:predicted peptidase